MGVSTLGLGLPPWGYTSWVIGDRVINRDLLHGTSQLVIRTVQTSTVVKNIA